MECNDKNQLYIKKYESFVREKYKEPVEGRFEDATADILRRINADHGEDEIVPKDETRTLALNLIWKLSNYMKFQIFTVVNSIFGSTKISVFDASR